MTGWNRCWQTASMSQPAMTMNRSNRKFRKTPPDHAAAVERPAPVPEPMPLPPREDEDNNQFSNPPITRHWLPPCSTPRLISLPRWCSTSRTNWRPCRASMSASAPISLAALKRAVETSRSPARHPLQADQHRHADGGSQRLGYRTGTGWLLPAGFTLCRRTRCRRQLSATSAKAGGRPRAGPLLPM
jgi:hypothetical protein